MPDPKGYRNRIPLFKHVSSVQNPSWLFDIGDYTTQLYGDYNKPIEGSL